VDHRPCQKRNVERAHIAPEASKERIACRATAFVLADVDDGLFHAPQVAHLNNRLIPVRRPGDDQHVTVGVLAHSLAGIQPLDREDGRQVNQVVITAIASTLAVGSIAVFNLANNLQSLPTSIFGVSLAIAIFPVFSEALARHDQEHFVKTFSVNFRRLIFLIVPISIFILLLRAQIVRVILGFGNFDWQDTYYTAQTLGWFSVSLFAQCLTPLLARSFYALEDTKTPVIISLAAIILNIAGSITLGRKMGVEGLALAFSLAAILNMLMLLFVLRLRVGNLDDKKIMLSVLRTGFNSLLAGGLVYLALQLMARLVNMQTFIGIFIQGLTAGMVGLIIYLILSLVTNCQEVIFVKRWLMRYLKPLIKESSKF